MMSFFSRSKVSAKKRLYDCIQSDRETIQGNMLESLKREIECVLKRYVELEGTISLEVKKSGKNKTYITAQAGIKA